MAIPFPLAPVPSSFLFSLYPPHINIRTLFYDDTLFARNCNVIKLSSLIVEDPKCDIPSENSQQRTSIVLVDQIDDT